MAKWIATPQTLLRILLILGCTGTQVLGNEHAKNLTRDLLSKYGSKDVIPVLNSSQPLNVTLRVLIKQIVEFDETRQQLTLDIWRKLAWKDEYLVWNPDDYNGLQEIFIIPSDVWTPRLVLPENVRFGFTSEPTIEINVQPGGHVNWYTPSMLRVTCKVNVLKFPFDTQQCNLTFMFWNYDVSRLDLFYFDDFDANQDVFSSNGVWQLLRVDPHRYEKKYNCCAYPFAKVVYTLTLERASNFYILSILVPSVLLTMITVMVFCMPPESGEKISLGMSNLLAFILFQQLISGNMAPQGDETPILNVYIFCMVVLGCVSIFASVYVLRLFHRSTDKPVPPLVIKVMTYISRQKSDVTWKTIAKTTDSALFYLFLVASVIFILVTFAMLRA
ncbi:neuronal acetylcholine receptor subunit alpha-10-like [Asterias amurensis]|uniref:neuronal acetylcholine receptor subunit alpha-10-like n=1 Tax=Asterias amurensis TaxID=7602 RepID=UPI003AB609C2